jgi:hypothetical protein
MQNSALIAAFVVLVVVVVWVILARKKEGFAMNVAADRAEYIDESQMKYNKLSDSMDPTRGNFGRVNDMASINRLTANIRSAMRTSDMEVGNSNTRLDVVPDIITAGLAPPNRVLDEAKKCEALRTRAGACAALSNPTNANCGVCLKGGTPYSDESLKGKHIGGMLVLPDDRREVELAARGSGKPPQYEATVGSCPAGYLFVNRAECESAVNRFDCQESGESGGFDGKTADGRSVAREKCAQAPAAGENVFIYEPRLRKFNANLRVLTPVGTGICRVSVTRRGDTAIIASGQMDKPGVEFVVPVNNIGEADELDVKVLMEVPYRSTGKPEVFSYLSNTQGPASPGYNQTRASAAEVCARIGTRIATSDEVFKQWQKGGQACSCGNTSTENVFPMQAAADGCSGGSGIVKCHADNEPNTWNGGKGMTWCYGVKIPKIVGNVEIFASALAFFNTLGAIARPPQEDKPDVWSEHGPDYQAPAYRAVLLQWESTDGRRTANFEPSIVGVNGQGPTNIASDGAMTFNVLRRFGTFSKSSVIMAPRPKTGGRMLTNQFWIWGNQPTSQTVKFTVKVPGIFDNPVNPLDIPIAPIGPLISNPETMKLLRTSPCLKDGQNPGAYSIECLTNLFVSSGGNMAHGKLATEDGGLSQLNKNGDMDAISQYLTNLYALATTGRDATGTPIGNDRESHIAAINNAAQLLFGFDITTPCEDISEDNKGNIVVVPIVGALSSDCLNYLWLNTGNDRDRGSEDTGRISKIKNTYTTIGDRYSGLRSAEGSKDSRIKYPFQACQRTGSSAPVDQNGSVNAKNVGLANTKGSLQAIQDWYDSIHKQANAGAGTEDGSKRQADFVDACYGITKAYKAPPVAVNAYGLMARWVRVLPTQTMGAGGTPCIQIPQIQIFDTTGAEIGKGKAAVSNSMWDSTHGPTVAVNGDARAKSHGEGEYHDRCVAGPDDEFWQIDLGREYKVAKVIFYPRTDCCQMRQVAAPVILINNAQQVVCQKQLYSNTWPVSNIVQPQVLEFKESDANPVVPLSTIKGGARLSFISATSFDRWLKHDGSAFYTAGTSNVPGASMPAPWRGQASFNIVNALNGRAGYISFQCASNTGAYLRHAGFRCWIHGLGSNQVYKDDASFLPIPAINGDPTMVTFQSSNFPSYYISTHRDDPQAIWLTQVTGSRIGRWDAQRASWTAFPALA